MKFGNLFLVFAIVGMLALAGCSGITGEKSDAQPSGRGGAAGFEKASAAPAPQAAGATDLPSNLVDKSGSLLIKKGDVDIEVPRGQLDAKLNELKGIITSSGGQVDSVSYYETEGSKTYYLTVKVPPSSFESLTDKFKGVGKLKSMDTSVDDVTLQWIDLEVRIKNLNAERERLLQLYNRSDNVKDIIEVERELTRVQTQLESTQAQKLRMERQIALSTITITLKEEAPLVESSLITVNNIVATFVGALAFGILLVAGAGGFLLPLAIVLAILLFIAKKIWDRVKGKAEAAKGKK